jgi:hypothetical protein
MISPRLAAQAQNKPRRLSILDGLERAKEGGLLLEPTLHFRSYEFKRTNGRAENIKPAGGRFRISCPNPGA